MERERKYLLWHCLNLEVQEKLKKFQEENYGKEVVSPPELESSEELEQIMREKPSHLSRWWKP